MKRWEENEIKELLEEFINGKTYEDLSIKFNRSKKGIRLKLHNLGYSYKNTSKYKTTKLCLECKKDFECKISEKRIFCSKSCSNSYNNKLRNKTVKNCLNCESVISKRKKYCNNICQNEYQNKKTVEEWLSGNNSGHINDANNSLSRPIRNYIFDKYNNKCSKCGWCEINPISNKIPLQIDHIDGDSLNSKEDNLILLCPNCHSLTPTYGVLNIGNGRKMRH